MPARTVHQVTGDAAGGAGGALHLTVMAPGTFESHPLPPTGAIRIGRDEGADVRITDELASRLHACLHLASPTEIFVEDLDSSNGTFVRGQRLGPGERVPLLPGEAVTIGYTHLTVQRRRPRTTTRRLHGHGAFEERLEDACARLGESGGTLSVARIKLNDEGSPERGAELVAAALRPGDFLAQYGPGDYEILLLDTEPGRAQEIAAAVVERAKAEGRTAHAAVVAAPTDGRSAEALIGRASARLRGIGDETRDPVLKSEAVQALYRMAERAANGQGAAGLINVLILGETGTGKEVLAEWIHRHSPRAAGPFICINCAALTDSLLESELFGHEKGAFTGAAQAKAGLLEAAAGGTVFLDEIGEMPAGLQTKLLRALESRQITRVGAVAPRAIDARFLAATNRDLEAEITAKTFRQDLYFRLNGISLTLPPLRERADEIEPLARRFLSQASAASRRRPPRLSAEALEILQAYAWPGNIRELRNVLERALVLCEGDEISSEQLPVEKMRVARPTSRPMALPVGDSPPAPAGPMFSPAEEVERQRVLEVMAQVGGNQTRAAKLLGMARGTLIERLKRYGFRRPQVGRD